MHNLTLTAVEGMTVGHWTDEAAATGCTAILCPDGGCVASGLALGGAPATRESDLLAPEKMMQRVDAVVLSGGSAFGLAAADGVARLLEERGQGFATRAAVVPIVVAASIYDLEVGDGRVRPNASSGYDAARAATADPLRSGRIGAGAGACCSVYLGMDKVVRTGLGTASITHAGATVAALAVANPAGDIRDPSTGETIAGHGLSAVEIADRLRGFAPQNNTTLVTVATDAPLSKADALALAVSAHVGIAHAIRPSHTQFDGDMAYVLSTGRGPPLSVAALGVLVQDVVAKAIVAAARAG